MGRSRPKGMIVLQRLKDWLEAVRAWLARRVLESGNLARSGALRAGSALAGARAAIVAIAVLGAAGYWLYRNPPVKTVGAGEVGVRLNRFTGELSEWREGGVLVLPGVHELRTFSLRDRSYRPEQARRADRSEERRVGKEGKHQERDIDRQVKIL